MAQTDDHQRDQPGEEYWYIFGAAMALSLLVGLYGFVGWAETGDWFKAALCVVAQIVSNCSAILGRRAWSKGMVLMGAGAFVVAVGFAYWSGLALEHAWSKDGEHPNPVAVWFLAGVEPFLFMAAEHVKRSKPLEWSKVGGGFMRLIGVGAAVATMGQPAQALEIAPTPVAREHTAPQAVRQHRTTPSRPVSASSEPTAYDRARARTMIEAGMGVADVHRETNVPKGTLKHWRNAVKGASSIPLAEAA